MSSAYIPTVSVIVPTCDRAATYLPVSLASIAEQTHPADEIIVVDDGSSDHTDAVVAAYGDRFRYCRQSNQGRPAALNHGIKVATGDYLLLFDDDDILLPDAIENHLAARSTQPDTEYVYSRYFVYDDHGDPKDIHERGAWRRGTVEVRPPDELLLATMEWVGAVLSSMLISRRCFDKVGLFDERFLRAQDYEFQLRLARVCLGGFLDRETFVSRVHEGDRGSRSNPIKGADRHALSHHYEQQIFRRVRAELPLTEYLPRDPREPVPEMITPEQRLSALTSRCRVMFARGLFVEGVADLGRILCATPPGSARFKTLTDLALYAANIGEPDFQSHADILARNLCRTCPTPAAAPLLMNAARGTFWTGWRAWRRGNWRALPVITIALTRLLIQRTAWQVASHMRLTKPGD